MTSFSYEIAASEYGEALLLWDGQSEARTGIDHVELLERSARAAYLASDFRHAVASCREAIDELGDQDAARLTDLLILLGRSLWVSGEWGPAIVAYERALATAPAEPPIVRVKALAGLAQVYMLHSRLLEARPLCEEAIEAATAIGARDLEGHGRNTLGVVLAFLGETDAAMASIEAALEIGLELGIPDDIGRAYVNKVDIEAWCGFPDQALETAEEGMRVAAEWGVSNTYGAYIGWGGVTAGFESGAWERALEILAQADRMTGSSEAGFVYRASYASELFANRGDERFLPLWERASRSILERPPSDFLGQLFLGGIEHAAFVGDHARATELAWQIIDLLRGVDAGMRLAEVARVASWPMAELGKAARLAGDETALAQAREHMDRLGAIATRWRQEMAEPSSRLGEMPRARCRAARGRARPHGGFGSLGAVEGHRRRVGSTRAALPLGDGALAPGGGGRSQRGSVRSPPRPCAKRTASPWSSARGRCWTISRSWLVGCACSSAARLHRQGVLPSAPMG